MLTAGAGSLPQVVCCSAISPMSEAAYIVTTAMAAGCIDMKHADWQYVTIEHSSCHMVQDEGCQPNVVTYNTLIDVYGKMGCWQEAVQVLDDMTEKVLSLHMFCLHCCWVNTPESDCNLAEACMGITHAAVAAYITGAIQNFVGGLLSWWVILKLQIVTHWCGTWHDTKPEQ